MLIFRTISPNEHSYVQSFYDSVGYDRKIQPTDKVIIAETDKNIIATARIAFENEHYVLRGMQVAKVYQRKNIGTQILFNIANVIDNHECYCIPYSWLEKFYEKINFKKIPEELAPYFLQDRIKQYRKKGYDLIIMKREKILAKNYN